MTCLISLFTAAPKSGEVHIYTSPDLTEVRNQAQKIYFLNLHEKLNQKETKNTHLAPQKNLLGNVVMVLSKSFLKLPNLLEISHWTFCHIHILVQFFLLLHGNALISENCLERASTLGVFQENIWDLRVSCQTAFISCVIMDRHIVKRTS